MSLDQAIESGPAAASSGNSIRREALLATRGLEVVFPGGVQAIREVDLDVGGHELVAVLGPSGAGKSTLLRCFDHLVAPTRGRVYFDGADVTRVSGNRLRKLRQRVGMIFQQFNLVGRLTVLENVMTGRLRRLGGPLPHVVSHARIFTPRQLRIALEALDSLGIADKAYVRADSLSGGQQQRVAIARLLAQDPQAILADEPIASLDPGSAASVMNTLAHIHRERGLPVIVNLHQVDVAKQYATRIIGMREGRIILDTTAADFDDRCESVLYGGNDEASDPPIQHSSHLPARSSAQPQPSAAVTTGTRYPAATTKVVPPLS